MQIKKTKLGTALMLCIGLQQLHAQEAISAAGSNASGTGGSVSYTVGQVVYITNTGLTATETQGIQQPFEISTVNVIDEAKAITLNCMAYPNPSSDFVILKIEGELKAPCIAFLYDMNGKLLVDKEIESKETSIAMGKLVSATYLLKIIQDNKTIATFKIIKK